MDTTISNYWMRLGKISWFVSGEQINYLRDTDKSGYFAITVFNNCFIIRSPRLFCKEYLWEAKRSAIVTKERSQEGEKRVFIYAWAGLICSQKQLNDIAHEHTIICRQLSAGHLVGSRPMKRKKHLHRMIKGNDFQYFVVCMLYS